MKKKTFDLFNNECVWCDITDERKSYNTRWIFMKKSWKKDNDSVKMKKSESFLFHLPNVSYESELVDNEDRACSMICLEIWSWWVRFDK
jgi:hypothetical protein